MTAAGPAARWHLALWPLLLVPALLPVGRVSELGTLLGLLAGLWLAWRQRAEILRLPSVRLLLALFGCYAGAALLSLPDAVEPGKSWTTFASIWRYLPFGVYACWVLRDGRTRVVYGVLAVLAALWALDAWVQMFTGWSLGGAAGPLRISGVFGADNLKLGPVLATLAPFPLWEARRRWGWRGLIVAFVLLLGPIVLAGARQAWVQFALVGVAFAWSQGRSGWQRGAWLAGAAVLGLATIGVAWQQSPGFGDRMQRTVQALDADRQGLDWALSGRLQIWGTAWRMLQAHPLNGVGVRDFRYAYPDYAAPGDEFVGVQACGPGQGACHPHQWLLEVATGTGLAGLALWLLGIGLGVRAWWRGGAAARRRAWPLTLALASSLFPLNTHLAFYSAWWGLLFWWLLVTWCALLLAPTVAAEPDRG